MAAKSCDFAGPRDALAERIFEQGRDIAFVGALVVQRLGDASLIAVHEGMKLQDFLAAAELAFQASQRIIETKAAKYLDARRHLLPGEGDEDDVVG